MQPDAYLKAIAACVSLAFAVAVLLGGPRRPQNVSLAVFLGLIGGNQAAETLRAAATDLADAVLWFRVATVFAALDPLALYYFASVFPERNRLNEAPHVAVMVAASAVFAFASLGLQPLELPHAPSVVVLVALTAFTALTYTLVFARVLHALGRRGTDRAMHQLFPAVCFAAIPLWSRFPGQVLTAATDGTSADVLIPLRVALMMLALALAVGFVAWHARRRGLPAASARAVRVGLGGAAALTTILVLSEWVAHLGATGALPALAGTVSMAVGRGAAPLRWLLFGAFVSMAVLRDHMLGMSIAARRRAARVLLGVTFAATAAILLVTGHVALRLPPPQAGPLELGLVATAVLLSQGFRTLVDRAATRLYGVPPQGDVAAAHDAYQRAVDEALAAGRAPLHDPELDRLRTELGIEAATARALERLAEARAQGPLEAGRLVAGRYRVVRLLGRGGGGHAFLARDEALARDVVVKEARLPGDAALVEARLAAGLRHPNVVTVHDVVERPASVLLVTEYVDGGTLAERVAREGPLPPREGHGVVRQVLAALAAAHEGGVVHRDIKPANVLLTRDGHAKLADFGLARALDAPTVHLGEAGAVFGTPGFLAPEQRAGTPTTQATDVYQAGLLARAVLRAPLPPALDAVLARALAHEPHARWPTAGAMLAAWDAAARDLGPEHQERPAEADDVPVTERR